MLGQDASDAFREFHFRSKKANAVLSSLPKKKKKQQSVQDPLSVQEMMMEDFESLRSTLIEEGFFKPNFLHVCFRILECLGFFVFGLLLLAWNLPILSVISLGIFGARAGWIQHEGGHGSLTGNLKWDKIIQKSFLGFGLAASGSMVIYSFCFCSINCQ